ncbi:MAG: tyrosine-type recombinase/integrase [Jiangellaceae bacterium]
MSSEIRHACAESETWDLALGEWDAAIDAWRRSMVAAGFSGLTLYQRRWQLRTLAAAFGDRSPWDLSGDDLVAWMAGHEWSRETRKSTRAALRGFYGWAVDTDRTARDPSRVLRTVRAPAGLPRPAGDLAVAQALGNADDKVTLMILLAGLAGLRVSEIGRLRWDDRDGAAVIVRGKGDRVRRVPLHPVLAEHLDAEHARRGAGCRGTGFYDDGDGAVWVFPGRTGAGMHPGHVSAVLSRALGPGTTPHQLRHRFASRAYIGTRDLRAVQQLLGHASPTTTAVYAAFADGALTAAVLAAG